MKLTSLTIENFGVYKGEHHFDLETHAKSNGKDPNVIVVKGSNGSGKSTFFRAITLALFGRLALGSRVSNKEYYEFVTSKFHKTRLQDNKAQSLRAGVSTTFEYIQSGNPKEIKVSRQWTNDYQDFELLDVKVDGHSPDIQHVDYQSWLNDVVPPGLMNVICFDAENMNNLIRSNNDDDFRKVIKRLLGLNLVEQLDDDLTYYLRKEQGGSIYTAIEDEVATSQSYLDSLNGDLEEKRIAQSEFEDSIEEKYADLSKYERELSSEGGDYAARRPILKDRINQLNKEIESLESEIRDLSTGLLPLTFAPLLSKKLSGRLNEELYSHKQSVAAQFLKDKRDVILKLLKSERQRGTGKQIENAFDEIQMVLDKQLFDDTGALMLHEMSESDVQKVQGWIAEASNSIPVLALRLTKELKEKKAERDKHQKYINRAPDDELLEPIYEKIRATEDDLSSLKQKNKTITEEIGSIQFKYDRAVNEHERKVEKLHAQQKEQRKLKMAKKSQMALEAYARKLSEKQIGLLADQLVSCFNRLCDKEQLLSDAQIDIDSYEVTMFDINQNPITVDDLSMGESQLYGLSLLWALREISGYNIPLLIDTPVARLDESHQENFINNFLPDVSEQVILFTTNVEMSNEIQNKIKPYTARNYDLEFLDKKGYTLVEGAGYRHEDKTVEQLKAI